MTGEQSRREFIIALAGNPNVGKSTIFNGLTGMRQHTGNWPGKTVSAAQGRFSFEGQDYLMIDLPGCYSLMARSAEEEAARDFICSGEADLIIVVCDATCLERNLNLVLQTIEISPKVLLCVNLLDEAKRKGIEINLELLSRRLGVPVAGISARSKGGPQALLPHIAAAAGANAPSVKPSYPEYILNAAEELVPLLPQSGAPDPFYIALRLLEGADLPCGSAVSSAARDIRERLSAEGHSTSDVCDDIANALVRTAQAIYDGVTVHKGQTYTRDRRIDRILTSRALGFPIMLLMLAVIFWLTIYGANYPSALLSSVLFGLEDKLMALCRASSLPPWLYELALSGVYRVIAWVVSVMLPPMAIFFPLFTLLEDLGYLPRVAFNLDRCFCHCHACGKQALTTMMGFGCNAVGVTGCRIIDSPRERLIAIITNSFVPCNGRFPTLVAVITMFFITEKGGAAAAMESSLMLTGVIVFSILMTMAASKLLSSTLLKGMPSSFTLELPPYRPPQVGKVIVRSVLDRTVFVLGRAVSAAAPAGLIIWLMANIHLSGATLLAHCAGFLDPFAKLLGLDGVILMAFVLGFPANEIVIPIMLMTYMSRGTLTDYSGLGELHTLLVQNGWSWTTAVSMLLFSLMHWPCATTCLTIKKETGSLKWTAVSILLPTLSGMLLCFVFNLCVNAIV